MHGFAQVTNSLNGGMKKIMDNKSKSYSYQLPKYNQEPVDFSANHNHKIKLMKFHPLSSSKQIIFFQ